MSVMDNAITLIRKNAEADSIEEQTEKIHIYIKMYRAGIDREKTRKILADLVENGVLEAAWAVVELKLREDTDEYKHEDIFGSMTDG